MDWWLFADRFCQTPFHHPIRKAADHCHARQKRLSPQSGHIEKAKEKISVQQKRLRELEAQLTEEENLEIVRMVKAVRMDNKELTAFLKAYASGLITLPDGMMEAEAAADPGDEDMEDNEYEE